MNENWPTKDKDIQTARIIMEEYANERDSDTLGLLEVVVDQTAKRMNFRLSGWVMQLAKHFVSTYGALQGDFITRQVISNCIVRGETLH